MDEYQESSWEVKGDRLIRLTISPSSMSLMGLHGLLQG
jgi:hypothetical protein